MDPVVAGGLSWLESLNSLRFFAADFMLCASSKVVLKVKSFSDNNRHWITASLIPHTMQSRSIVLRVSLKLQNLAMEQSPTRRLRQTLLIFEILCGICNIQLFPKEYTVVLYSFGACMLVYLYCILG